MIKLKDKVKDKVLFESIQHAVKEMNEANDLFNQLTDETAVDYAAYNLLAARTKYSYLIKLAKKNRLTV